MTKMILTCALLASCSPTKPAPMSGLCVDRLAPNIFIGDANAPDEPFTECRWRSQTWICRLEQGADAWRCVAITRTAPAAPAAPAPAGRSE